MLRIAACPLIVFWPGSPQFVVLCLISFTMLGAAGPLAELMLIYAQFDACRLVLSEN